MELCTWHDSCTVLACAKLCSNMLAQSGVASNNERLNWRRLLSNILLLTTATVITMMSWWARWCLKSQASRLFTQPFIQAQIRENITAPRHWPLCGEFTGEFPTQRASNAEIVSIWWRHHVTTLCEAGYLYCFSLNKMLKKVYIGLMWRHYKV